jgi:flagellar hook protein FlgE
MSFQQGLSGLNAASRDLDVIGHNIANANTTGFKSQRTEFAELYARSLGASGGSTGGIGVEVAAVSQQFTQGNITITANDLDLAINGAGFFNVTATNGDRLYTRSGEFKLDKEGFIVTNDGAKVNGYRVDPETGLVQRGALNPIELPTSKGVPAKRTAEIVTGVNLDARAVDPTGGPPPATQVPPIETYATSLVVYDSQGRDVPVNLYYSKTVGTPNSWDVFAVVEDLTVTDPPTFQTLGAITFDANGLPTQPLAVLTPINVTTNADPAPFTIEVDIENMTQFGTRFSVNQLEQDGYAPGEFTGLAISEAGVVSARYSNGETFDTWQVALSNFRNLNGLAPQGAGYWTQTAQSGEPVPGAARDAGFGSLRQGALEDSNTDLTAELVNLITAQRYYQANAQTIRTQDQVFGTLVNLR